VKVSFYFILEKLQPRIIHLYYKSSLGKDE